MLCPTCKTPLTMSERQGIEIDYCATCRGVWLDRGELDKIIERSAAQPAAPPPPPPPTQQHHTPQPYAQHHAPWGDHNRGYPKHKRRKSFFEELFD